MARHSSSSVYQKKRQRKERKRRVNRRQRLLRQRKRAQAHLNALEKSFDELLPASGLSRALRSKFRKLHKLVARLFVLMMPSAFGFRSYTEQARGMGLDKNLPGQLLSALPKRSWQGKFRRLGLHCFERLLAGLAEKSDSTRQRHELTLVVDSSVFRRFCQTFRLAAPAYSGQYGTIVQGVDVVLLVAVIGDGKAIVPLDFEIRRPDPEGMPGACYDKLSWTQVMLDRCLEQLDKRSLLYHPPRIVADSWFASSELMEFLFEKWGALFIVNGKSRWVFYLDGGLKVQGRQLYALEGVRWKRPANVRGLEYARLFARSPSFGRVVLTLVREDCGREYYLFCPLHPAVAVRSPSLIRWWKRRSWIEWCFRALKHLLRAGLCQVQGEDSYYGHLSLRLMALSLLLWTARQRLGGKVSVEEILEGIQNHWRELESEKLAMIILAPAQSAKAP